MVFTAITYSDFDVIEEHSASGKLLSLTFKETATAAAGGELSFQTPQSSNVAQVWERLKGKNFRIVSWYIYGSVVTGAVKLSPKWFGQSGGSLTFPRFASVIITDGETVRIDVELPVYSSRPYTPPYLASVTTSALTANDVFVSIIAIEVID